MDVLTISLIVALAVAFIIIVLLTRKQNTNGAGSSIVTQLVGWFTQYSMRWNKLVVALILLAVFNVMASPALRPDTTPPEVWWFAAGAIITGLIGWMLSPDPSKSEVLELAQQVIKRDEKRAGSE